jgi:hypothetical protein
VSLSITKVDVKLVSPKVDLLTGLARPLTLAWVANAIDSSIAREQISRDVPVDGVEVVEWMQWCAADNAVLEAMEVEYNRLGSQVLTGSGDAYIPGVRVGDLRGESVRGEVVSSRGYGIVITPHGNFRVPVGGKTTIAIRDLLAWATIPWSSYLQWVLTLIQWRDLTTLPVRQRVRFASSNGLVAPQFFSFVSRLPLPLVTFRIRITSDKEQEITLRGRGTRGSYETVLYETKFNVEAGDNEVVINIVGIPIVQSHTVEIQPSDNTQTVLDSFEVFPPI